jgi:hypothetical protein
MDALKRPQAETAPSKDSYEVLTTISPPVHPYEF